MKTTAKQLETRRERLGVSYAKVHLRVFSILGEDYTPSIETLRRYHDDNASGDPDPFVLGALCEIYGLSLVDVAPETARYLLKIGRRLPAWVGMIDLTECAPWELNPQPADSHAAAGQLSLLESAA
jgi:hypothetical protein